jgi:hypothetical protein
MSINLSQIDWGNDSAERDPNLLKYFVPPSDFEKAAKLRKPIITGRKGAGKSALRKKLESDFAQNPKVVVASVAPNAAAAAAAAVCAPGGGRLLASPDASLALALPLPECWWFV